MEFKGQTINKSSYRKNYNLLWILEISSLERPVTEAMSLISVFSSSMRWAISIFLCAIPSAIPSAFKVFRATPSLNVTNIEDHIPEQINQDASQPTENGN